MTPSVHHAVAQPYAPELAAALTQVPEFPLWKTDEEIREARERSANFTRNDKDAILSNPEYNIQDEEIPSLQGALPITIITSKNAKTNGPRPGIFHIHGGGMVMGDRFTGANLLTPFVGELDAVLVTVEYGLAPENKGMGLVEDCFAALKWFAEHLADFNIDPDRLLLAGASAGGGLAAGTALLARDRQGPALCGQLLLCPMLDDRNSTLSIAQYENERRAFSGAQNRVAWECVLGEQAGKEGVSMYVAPARAEDLSRLPPAFLQIGGADPFRDEAIMYALKLSQCGVLTEFHLWAGGFHGYEKMAADSSLARLSEQAMLSWVHRVLKKS